MTDLKRLADQIKPPSEYTLEEINRMIRPGPMPTNYRHGENMTITATTEPYYVETFAELPTDVEVGQILLMKSKTGGRDSAIRRTDKKRPWNRVTVETFSVVKERYQDERHDYAVTFEGGTPSATSGWELPFATMPPRDRHVDQYVAYSTHTPEQKDREHNDRIKNIIKAVTKHWDSDHTVGETRSMGQSWLDVFSCVNQQPFFTTYQVVIIVPNMD